MEAQHLGHVDDIGALAQCAVGVAGLDECVATPYLPGRGGPFVRSRHNLLNQPAYGISGLAAQSKCCQHERPWTRRETAGGDHECGDERCRWQRWATTRAAVVAVSQGREQRGAVARGVGVGVIGGLAAAVAVAAGPAMALQPGPPSVLHVGQIGRQDVPVLPGSEPDTLVEPDIAVSPVTLLWRSRSPTTAGTRTVARSASSTRGQGTAARPGITLRCLG